MKIGYLPGVFDMLHVGHRNIIDRAIQSCDTLILGVHTDAFVTEYKRRPFQTEAERLEQVRRAYGTSIAHYVLVGSSHKQAIDMHGVTHIFHGSDWELESYKRQIRYEADGLSVAIVILPYTDTVSTTAILDKVAHYRHVTTLLFDLDQTLLLNGRPTHGAIECVRYIHERPHLRCRVITNNTKYTPDEIALSLRAFDIPSAHIMSPLVSIDKYLCEMSVGAVYVWGSPSARAYLHAHASSSLDDADLIVLCYRDDFTYAELCALLTKLRTTPYITSNIDRTYPDAHCVLPDVGAIQQLIEFTTGAPPVRMFGKPDPSMFDMTIEERAGCIMVGDREMTDGKLAEALGCPFFHVHGAHDLAMLHIILKGIHDAPVGA